MFNLVKYIIVIFVFFIVGYSLFKIFNFKKSTNNHDTFPKIENVSLHWDKNKLIVPVDQIKLANEDPLKIETQYTFIEYFKFKNTKYKCLLGNFKYLELKKDRFILSSNLKNKNSKLEEFSKLLHEKIYITNELAIENKNETPLILCSNWVYLSNNLNSNDNLLLKSIGYNENLKNKNVNISQIKQIKLNTCIYLPNQKFLMLGVKFRSKIKLTQDILINKIKLCGKKVGMSKIIVLPEFGGMPYAISFKVTKGKLSVLKSKNLEIKNKVNSKLYPGWI